MSLITAVSIAFTITNSMRSNCNLGHFHFNRKCGLSFPREANALPEQGVVTQECLQENFFVVNYKQY